MSYHMVVIKLAMTVTENRPTEREPNQPIERTVNGEFSGSGSSQSNALEEAHSKLRDFVDRLNYDPSAGPKRVN